MRLKLSYKKQTQKNYKEKTFNYKNKKINNEDLILHHK